MTRDFIEEFKALTADQEETRTDEEILRESIPEWLLPDDRDDTRSSDTYEVQS